MTSIVAYRKIIDALTTRELRRPEDSATLAPLGQEIAELDGVTYYVLPDGATLPAGQPEEIAASIAPVTLTPELRAAIEKASPHARLIEARVAEALPEGYSVEAEAKLALTVPNADAVAYGARAAQWRTWARAEKAKLGL